MAANSASDKALRQNLSIVDFETCSVMCLRFGVLFPQHVKDETLGLKFPIFGIYFLSPSTGISSFFNRLAARNRHLWTCDVDTPSSAAADAPSIGIRDRRRRISCADRPNVPASCLRSTIPASIKRLNKSFPSSSWNLNV